MEKNLTDKSIQDICDLVGSWGSTKGPGLGLSPWLTHLTNGTSRVTCRGFLRGCLYYGVLDLILIR